MNTADEVRNKLVESLGDKAYRHLFASASSRRAIAEQIREMRLSRGWTQADLAKASGKVQETISELENPNYGSYTYKTLQRLAEAFDVALIVKFAPFSELVRWMTALSPEDLAVPDFDHDPGLVPVADFGPAATATAIRQVTEGHSQPSNIVYFPVAAPSYQRETRPDQEPHRPPVPDFTLISDTAEAWRA